MKTLSAQQLALYLGCEGIVDITPNLPGTKGINFHIDKVPCKLIGANINVDNSIRVIYPEPLKYESLYFEGTSKHYEDSVWPFQFKPILRRIEDMTDEEKKDVYALIFKKPFPDSGQIVWRADKTISSEPRWILMTGVDRVGIQMDGTVWADCDLHIYKHNQHEITTYLLSKHFDLFSWIESGNAIDKTTLK
jgi:hypothetical protein